MAALSTTALVVVIALVVAAGGGGIWAIVYYTTPKAGGTPSLVALGDNVTVDYVGTFGSGPDTGRVFDTSVFAVSQNSALYPKSLQYQPRGNSPSNYTPLGVHVGPNAPSGGYTLGNLTFVGVVTGFWQGLVGAHPNQTVTIIVPPALGYGFDIPRCLVTRPLVQQLPVLLTLSGPEFARAYPGVSASTGTVFKDPRYGWEAIVFSANASFVTVQNLPYVGETSSPFGWPVTVTSILSTPNGTGAITVQNDLTPAQAGHIAGVNTQGTAPASCSGNPNSFIVSAVNLAQGTYVENYNSEVTGQTLIFQVKVLDVFPPGTA